ncbi:MAG: 2-C-methyl-D-erythritol 2,4-cyclodiphosphate synthase, partial [Candidatus Izemoplasmatales bacterium]|nr:2-C-methyl-D-erythritol 2,4-cyclodiphosphate synthase [Candidatus Izemoplasmatales bacterium]
INSRGYEISNLDTMVSLESPKIRSYIKDIRENIAGILNCDVKLISVKATTFEGLGFVGRKEGILCEAVVVLEKSDYMLD